LSSSPQSSAGLQGIQFPEDGASDFNAIAAIFKSMLSRVATATLVQVKKCTNDGGVTQVGFVDIQPLINQVDGDGNAVPHGIIYGCPYSRMQGGANAIIMDPEPGDIGVAVFASRDIAGVVAKRGPANPGSNGRFRWSDGLYLGGALNGVPTQWIRFSADGIDITSPTAISMEAPVIRMTAPDIEMLASGSITAATPTFYVNGAVVVTGAVQAAEVDAPIVTVDETLMVAGKSMGPDHYHDHGTMTSTGHSGVVISP
jgi:hypothetical protein